MYLLKKRINETVKIWPKIVYRVQKPSDRLDPPYIQIIYRYTKIKTWIVGCFKIKHHDYGPLKKLWSFKE